MAVHSSQLIAQFRSQSAAKTLLQYLLESSDNPALLLFFGRISCTVCTFPICITNSDQARARVFMSRRYQARVFCAGEDCEEALRVKDVMERPATFRHFGLSDK